VIELFTEVDGNFPNHHPDPSKPENLRDVIAALQTSDAELGLAFRRRRRPPGHRHQGRPEHLPRPPDDAVRATCCRACPAAPSFDVKCTQRLAPAIARPAACR
jgi:phosphomannomutase